MKVSGILIKLCWLIVLFILVYAALGLFWQAEGSPSIFTTMRGQTVDITGEGLYRFDTKFFSAGFRGNDAVTIILEVPLLIIAILLYKRGSLKGGFLLAGSLAYVLYNSFSLGTSAAYNSLFLVYTGTFTASLLAMGLLWGIIDFGDLQNRIQPGMPHRSAAIYLFIAGTMTALLWLSDILPGILQGNPPSMLGPYTTTITYFMDLGIISPLCILAGVWLLRSDPRGTVVGFILLYLLALMGCIVIGQTVFQLNAGIVFNPGQLIGMIGSWVIMGSIATGFVVKILRNISN